MSKKTQKSLASMMDCNIYPMKTLSGSGIESDTKQKQVEALPLGESVKPETHC